MSDRLTQLQDAVNQVRWCDYIDLIFVVKEEHGIKFILTLH